MFLFVFRPNPEIAYQANLPVLQIIASSEEEARDLSRDYVRIHHGPSPVTRQVSTGVVGVYAWETTPRVHWQNPYFHKHLTTCEKREIPTGVFRFGYEPVKDNSPHSGCYSECECECECEGG